MGPPIKLWGIYLDNRLGGGALPPSIFGWQEEAMGLIRARGRLALLFAKGGGREL